jgi:hypothetical protein
MEFNKAYIKTLIILGVLIFINIINFPFSNIIFSVGIVFITFILIIINFQQRKSIFLNFLFIILNGIIPVLYFLDLSDNYLILKYVTLFIVIILISFLFFDKLDTLIFKNQLIIISILLNCFMFFSLENLKENQINKKILNSYFLINNGIIEDFNNETEKLDSLSSQDLAKFSNYLIKHIEKIKINLISNSTGIPKQDVDSLSLYLLIKEPYSTVLNSSFFDARGKNSYKALIVKINKYNDLLSIKGKTENIIKIESFFKEQSNIIVVLNELSILQLYLKNNLIF